MVLTTLAWGINLLTFGDRSIWVISHGDRVIVQLLEWWFRWNLNGNMNGNIRLLKDKDMLQKSIVLPTRNNLSAFRIKSELQATNRSIRCDYFLR